MSATKRKAPVKSIAATRTTRLASRVSEFNSQVTLFEAPELRIESQAEQQEEGTSSPRRKRVKIEVTDLEDLAYVPENTLKKKITRGRSVKKVEDVHESKVPAASGLQNGDVKSPLKKSTTKAKVKAIPQTLDTPHPAPTNWRETYDTIKGMRSQFVAPVDTMGCDQAQTKEVDPKNGRYATLVSLMLSSQTKDEVTDAAVSKLRTAFGGSISVDAMIDADDSAISEAIAKVGFWRRKTGYLKQAAIKLRDNFDSDVPKTVDELCSLPGVGPKMAFLALQIAWNLNHGIGVDVHVHRITNLLGWHKPPTKTPEQTRLNLQSWLPKDLHGEINHMLVGFGQVVCLPVSPRCDVCELSTKGLCPSARKVVKSTKNRKEIIFSKVEDIDGEDTKERSLPELEVMLEEGVEETKVLVPPT